MGIRVERSIYRDDTHTLYTTWTRVCFPSRRLSPCNTTGRMHIHPLAPFQILFMARFWQWRIMIVYHFFYCRTCLYLCDDEWVIWWCEHQWHSSCDKYPLYRHDAMQEGMSACVTKSSFGSRNLGATQPLLLYVVYVHTHALSTVQEPVTAPAITCSQSTKHTEFFFPLY